ncbi:hypothetical protein HYH02_013927 [Chlamydomonas schloesseri]|uniref:Uncharacterized protein n=1 Tax=Chlamydomonas schloesseri TaxID=2026947 RepID=A0A835SQI7_9CHLO|nr:hypothetical protein HYH02_013927 [Chlamydomonas schloesseri]|eukprot:KAG2429976.1 hypothetical protein HYH02_013927 [Chlamydomonas schloesseri]
MHTAASSSTRPAAPSAAPGAGVGAASAVLGPSRAGPWRHVPGVVAPRVPAPSVSSPAPHGAFGMGAAVCRRGCSGTLGAVDAGRGSSTIGLATAPHRQGWGPGGLLMSCSSMGAGSTDSTRCCSLLASGRSRGALCSGPAALVQRRHFSAGGGSGGGSDQGTGGGGGKDSSDRSTAHPAASQLESGAGSSATSSGHGTGSSSAGSSATGGGGGDGSSSGSSRPQHRQHHRQPGEVVGAHVRRQLAPAAALDPVGAQDDEQRCPPHPHGGGHAATAGEALKAVAATAGAGRAGSGAGDEEERVEAAARKEAQAAEAEAVRAGLAPLDALRAAPPSRPAVGGSSSSSSSSSSSTGIAAAVDAAGAAAAAAAAAEVAESYARRFNGGAHKGSAGGPGGAGGDATAATESAAGSRSLDSGATTATDNDGGWDARRLEGLTASHWYGGGPAAAVAAVPCGTVGYGTRAEVVARLPASIMLLRHAECMTLDALQAHERVPNHDIPLSPEGEAQARLLGRRLRPLLAAAGMHLFVYTSPFLRCSETTRLIAEELGPGLLSGCREAVQLREQDWGNFQDPRVQAVCKEERLRYGRFYYRFPAGESVADVYDRLTIFQDHLVRDMCAGRFQENTCVAVVSHGLTLRAFAMRWLHWTVYNIPNAEPVLLHKDVDPAYLAGHNAALPFMPHHTKCLYRLTPRALELLRGAESSMATSSGCWQGAILRPPPPPRLVLLKREGDGGEQQQQQQQQQQGSGITSPEAAAAAEAAAREAERRMWEDVDGMVASE